MPKAQTLLAIDYGQATTGLAVGHPLTGSAQPLTPIHTSDQQALLAGVMAVVKEWQPGTVVVGLPLNADGQESTMSQHVRDFGDALAAALPDVPIIFHDERLTTVEARARHTERRQHGQARAKDVEKMDSMAAALILESWMHSQGAPA